MTSIVVRRDKRQRLRFDGLWQPLQTKDVQVNLVRQLFVGFAHNLQDKMGSQNN